MTDLLTILNWENHFSSKIFSYHITDSQLCQPCYETAYYSRLLFPSLYNQKEALVKGYYAYKPSSILDYDHISA